MKKHPYIFIFLILIGVIYPSLNLGAQDISKIKDDPVLKITGNLGLRLGAYRAIGIENRRDPYSYLLRGNVDINVKGFHIPLGFSFSQQEYQFFQPFHHFGLSPSYKWFKLHLGYRHMKFSRYSLNNHLFLGSGIELELPTSSGPRIQISGMYGRLRRAISTEDAFLNNGSASFKRIGYGGMIKLISRRESKNFISLDVLRARDDKNSINSLFYDYSLEPKDNIVLGIDGQFQLFPRMIISSTLGYSAMTDNTTFTGEKKLPFFLRPFSHGFKDNSSTEFNTAFRIAADYHLKTMRIGATYERIDPRYNSLGAYYFRNDVESVKAHFSKMFRKYHLSISGAVGLQRNNLDDEKNAQSERIIASLQLSQSLFERLSYSLNLSNHSSSIKVVRDELSDSLNLYQITSSASLNSNFMLSPNSSNKILYLSFSAQQGQQRDEYMLLDHTTIFYHASTGVRWKFPNKNLSLNTGILYTFQKSQVSRDVVLGPTINVSRAFWKKRVDFGYTVTLSHNTKGGGIDYTLLDNRVSTQFRLNKLGAISFSFSHLYKNDNLDASRTYTELRSILSYNYRF